MHMIGHDHKRIQLGGRELVRNGVPTAGNHFAHRREVRDLLKDFETISMKLGEDM